ncbi:MAG: YggS family pyridoxal phosphate-dependent enzyme [Verrucomicrobiales bacterium]|jgi:pyridoxal phosphate enzyme (YggS family)|nr:YggS family pyridoxal phosphate-dependent enzyme [Verrucomicrobiales bacterium]|tara:strand:+ start:3601 stop:4293 length:693 start_codon:yes stop_codon:yes gene_type:complete
MSIAENLSFVEAEVSDAAARVGRLADEITLIAVSKTWPVDVIQEAVSAGHRIFGENKVQEILEKVPAMSFELKWHLIGHLQKNKTRKVLPYCAMIHSVDSLGLALQIDRIAGELGLKPEILLQVNVARDEAKFGLVAEDLENIVSEVAQLEQVQLKGLMTVPAFDPDPEKVRPHFAALRELRDQLTTSTGVELPELSMGMSHDFRAAIEEGATQIRVGSSIFGQRDYSRS